jgi:flagella basal body P-ring formation protein FlgA
MLGHLDLADLAKVGQEISVSREQVSLRMQIAGIEPGRFHLTGALRSRVVLDRQEVTSQSILAAAERTIRQRLPGDAEDVSIRLAQPLSIPKLDIEPTEAVRLTADLRTPLPVGRVKAEVSIYVNGQRRTFVPLFLDVTYAHQAAVVRRRVQAGEVLREADLAEERSLVDGGDVSLTVAECVGKRSKGALAVGQRISEGDLDMAPVEEPVLVKSREMVRMVAQVGSLRLTTVGEALQDGRAGETIRVRNVDSNKTVNGRVLDRGVVEVDY